MRNYQGMRLAPNMGVAQLREEAQRADNYLRHVSAILGRMSPAPQGSGPAGGSGGTVVDLNQFWYLPGRPGVQRAYGTNLVEAGVFPAGGLSAPTKPKRMGFFAYDDTKGNANIWLYAEGTAGTHISGFITNRTFYPDRYWVFPAFNQLASGDGGNLHYFVDADSRQLIAGKTFTSWVIETPDNAGVGIVNNLARGENQSGLANALALTFHGSFPTTTWKYTASAPSGGSHPSVAFPPLDVNPAVTAPNREKKHIFAIMRRDHTASTVFEPGGVLMGGGTGRELYPLYTTAQGTLPAPVDNSFMMWHPNTTKSSTFTTSSDIVLVGSTAGLYPGMRMREVTPTSLPDDVHVVQILGATNFTMSATWPGANVTVDVQYFGLTWMALSAIDHGSLTGLLDDDHPQYLNLGGRSGGQSIGSSTPASGTLWDLTVTGRLQIDPNQLAPTYLNGRALNVGARPGSPPVGALVSFSLDMSSMAAGGTTTVFQTLISGVPTAGTHTARGFVFASTAQGAPGVTFTDNISALLTASCQSGGGVCNKITGARIVANGDATPATTANGTVALELLATGRAATTTLTHLSLQNGTVASSGVISDYWGITWGAVAVQDYAVVGNWTAIQIPNAPTNPTGVIRALAIGSIKSHHVGAFRFGDTTTPTQSIEITAGTTAQAPLLFTSGPVLTTPVAGAIEFLTDDLYLTISTGPARKSFVLTDGTNLTSGRIPFATTNGRLVDDSDLTFATDTLTVTKIAATTLTGTLTFADAINMAVGSTTGTKIGTATTQKLGFWNAAPIVQPTTGITAATFTANTSGIADDTATWDGYTIGQVVAALRLMGVLA